MKHTFTLRQLFVLATAALLLVPVVALTLVLFGTLANNQEVLSTGGDQVHAAQEAVTTYTADRWDLAVRDRAAFEAGLATVEGPFRFAFELRDLENRVLYASPGVQDGEYHSDSGWQWQPTYRMGLVRKGDVTLGVMQIWVWPVALSTGVARSFSAALWAAALALVGLLVWLLWWIRRALLQPLQKLEAATAEVAAGSLEFGVPDSQVRELAALSGAFGDMRDRLKAALERQQTMEAERRQFLAAVGHDLRTPLSSVRAFAEGLRDGLTKDPARAVHYGEVILGKTAELQRLVDDLFELARLDLPGSTLSPVSVDAAAYLGPLVAAFGPQAAAAGIHLTAEGPALSVRVDPDLFSRVMGNLLSNALRHTPAGGSVSVTWAAIGDEVAVSVADTGQGIPEEELPRLFSPLHRTDQSRSRRKGGAGLGLAIAARLVALHGGSISCASSPGEGTRFDIRLPST